MWSLNRDIILLLTFICRIRFRFDDDVLSVAVLSYSETGCSFARHFAILSRNVGILIGSLLRASCDSNFNLLPEQTVLHIGILWVDCDGKQHWNIVSKREKVISLWSSGYRNKEMCSRLHPAFTSTATDEDHEAASWKLSSQLARSKLPIKIPILPDNIAKWRANEQPVSL